MTPLEDCGGESKLVALILGDCHSPPYTITPDQDTRIVVFWEHDEYFEGGSFIVYLETDDGEVSIFHKDLCECGDCPGLPGRTGHKATMKIPKTFSGQDVVMVVKTQTKIDRWETVSLCEAASVHVD